MNRTQSDLGTPVTFKQNLVWQHAIQEKPRGHTDEHFYQNVVVCNLAIISLHFSISFYIRALNKDSPQKKGK